MQNSTLIAENRSIQSSAPCRLDMAGTLDLSTFFYPLGSMEPCTFNLALDLRTRVRLSAYEQGRVKVVSRGFESAVFESGRAPFNHPLGLMFAIAAAFNASGVMIEIDSGSPPRAGLGGSSAAAVALVAAFYDLLGIVPEKHRSRIALHAHGIEQSVAGVPCGLQDHLAAAFGGVNCWRWQSSNPLQPFERVEIGGSLKIAELGESILVAYCGVPHESRDINGKWVKHFIEAKDRNLWKQIVKAGHRFVSCLSEGDLEGAGYWMNMETDLRCRMTPEVLESIGYRLVQSARDAGCGARFTGAGGGGCLWALGTRLDIKNLRAGWLEILRQRPETSLLEAGIDQQGVLLS